MSEFVNTSAGAGIAQARSGQTVNTLLGSLATSFTLFGVQFLVFYLLKNKFTRIYRPKTYLVPEKDRTKPPPSGLFAWALPVFRTSNSELISKCGLDAYFFLRYLRMLLKIFVPSAFLILPILLPINASTDRPDVKGLDKLGWQNYDPKRVDRFWSHLILATILLFWTCYVIYDELRGYIRVRQAYLTSPQHRLRASATTVLVTSIPRKWLTYEALDGLYDVFPGGIRNIWINRNFDELNDKVQLRDSLALKLEAAETSLIRNAKKKQLELQKKEEKKAGKKRTKKEQKMLNAESDAAAAEAANQPGLSSGNPHQVHTLSEALGESESEPEEELEPEQKPRLPIPGFGRGLEAVSGGFGAVGHGISRFGRKIVGDVTSAPKFLNERVDRANVGAGFSYDGTAEQEPGEHELRELERGRSETPESATAAAEPRLSTTTTQMPERRTAHFDNYETKSITDGATTERIDHAESPAAKRTSVVSDFQRPLISQDSTRTAVEQHADATRPVSSHMDQPIEKVDWTNGFLEPAPKRGWKIWKDSHGIMMPSPEPKRKEDAELKIAGPAVDNSELARSNEPEKVESKGLKDKILGIFSSKKGTADDESSIKEEYPQGFNEEFADDAGGETEPEWKKYLEKGDRDTMRLPLFGLSWMPFMPSWTFIGKKVDTIYYCRKELAQLNLEIEHDQADPTKFPLMNSAFIQFNHQVAAHMACQSVNHHVPNHMAPRLVEIAPGDVIWDNMSIRWWERFLRIGVVFTLVSGLIIAWAIPVSFTSAVSNLTTLKNTWSAFHWIGKLPTWLINAIQGVLPWLFVTILLAVLPLLLRFAAKQQGVATGMAVELSVQGYYFAFLFVQLFLVVTVASSIFTVIGEIARDPSQIARILATNIPASANYFFSYLTLQALSVSAGAIAQVVSLVQWFVFRPLFDNTARQKFQRQLNLPTIRWGTFFPVYTNLACIGLIYSVIAPLIMVFNIITFGLFWVVYRYQTLYVNKFRFDTGGLLFPKAVNQLFTGIYVMEIALVGLFIVRDAGDGGTSTLPQAIVMIVLLIFTALYQILLNMTFSPLYRYMPITLEDDAVRRDEEFERAQSKRWQAQEDEEEKKAEEGDIEDRLERREEEEEKEEKTAEAIESEEIKKRRSHHITPSAGSTFTRMGSLLKPRIAGSWADRARSRKSSMAGVDLGSHSPSPSAPSMFHRSTHHSQHRRGSQLRFAVDEKDAEAGTEVGASKPHRHTTAVGDALFGSFSDEIEDLTAEERDTLTLRAFQHEALRARRPVIWIPRDDLGISDDEIRRTQAFSDKIWISNEYTGLDRKVRVMFKRAPPDFSEVDLIEL